MKKYLVAIALLMVAGVAFAQWGGSIWQVDFRGVKIGAGASGTKLDMLTAGTVTMDNGSTQTTVTITGAGTSDIPIVTPAETLGSAAEFGAAMTANTLTITVDTDPGADVDFHYAVFGVAE